MVQEGVKMKRKETLKLVEGAMATVLVGVLFIIDLYTGGMIGYFLFLIIPTLIVWYSVRYRISDTVVLGISMIVVTLLVASPLNIFYVIFGLLSGQIAAIGVKRKVKPFTLLLLITGATLIAQIILYTLAAGILEMNIVMEITEVYHFMTTILPTMPISLETMLSLIPITLLMMSIIEAYLMIMCMNVILPRVKVAFECRINFLLINLPQIILLLIPIMILCRLYLKNDLISNLVTFVSSLLFVVQGVSYLGLVLSKKRQVLPYTIVMLCVFIPYSWPIFGIIGVVDIIFGLKSNLLYNIR